MRRIEAAWERLCAGRGLAWGLLLYPLSCLYGLASGLLRLGQGRRVKGLKVISVGNLSMGGSGKSPLVVEIARALKKQKLAVLSRGYGGDEAAMIAQALPGAGIVLDANRLRGAKKALAAGAKTAILDDGFQRRHQLARDLDILVLDWQRSNVEAHCLPAGRLREPQSRAVEADAVVVTHAPAGWNAEALRAALPQPFKGLRVFRGDHQPLALRSLKGASKPLAWLRGRSIVAMSGIGRPDAFERSLEGLGAKVESLRFGDHHAYHAADIPPGKTVLTTAKDAVKLKGFAGDIWILEMRMALSPQPEFEAMIKR